MRPAQLSCVNRFALPLLGLVVALGGCASKAPNTPPPPPVTYAEAILYNGTGQRMGAVSLLPEGNGIQGMITLSNGALTPGEHGLHIHTVGKCTPPDFTSVGAKKEDLAPLTVDATGGAQTSFSVSGTFSDMFDIDGASIVVDAGAAPAPESGEKAGSAESADKAESEAGPAAVLCGILYRKQR